MIIRPYEERDLKRIEELHRSSGFPYKLLDPQAPSCIVKRVVCDGDDIVMAAFLRQTTEAYLVTDSKWRSPAWRWAALQQLQADVVAEAVGKGVENAQAFIPPSILKAYSKRLRFLGWQQSDWPVFFFPRKEAECS